jgi:hypothetical protein
MPLPMLMMLTKVTLGDATAEMIEAVSGGHRLVHLGLEGQHHADLAPIFDSVWMSANLRHLAIPLRLTEVILNHLETPIERLASLTSLKLHIHFHPSGEFAWLTTDLMPRIQLMPNLRELYLRVPYLTYAMIDHICTLLAACRQLTTFTLHRGWHLNPLSVVIDFDVLRARFQQSIASRVVQIHLMAG